MACKLKCPSLIPREIMIQAINREKAFFKTLQFSRPTAHRAEGLLHLDFLSVCLSFSDNLKPCDWLTRFMRVISLGLSSVNRFCSTDWDIAKCVKVVYRSVHICHSSRHKVVLRRNLMMIITMRMRLTKS